MPVRQAQRAACHASASRGFPCPRVRPGFPDAPGGDERGVNPIARSAVGRTHYSSEWATPSGSGSRGARIHTSCAIVSAPTFDRAFARWCFTVECDW